MTTPLQKVRRFVTRHTLLEGSRGVLVAVSGGPDSVALLDMLMIVGGWGQGVRDEQRRGGAEDLGCTEPPLLLRASSPPLSSNQLPSLIPQLHVAHLDHMLRGRESAEDAEFVRALAERFGLKATIKASDVRGSAERLRRGVEEIARELRYRFLLDEAIESGCDRIAVGHTMSDQAETVLMRLVRGAGLRGLSAMRPIVPAHSFGQERDRKAQSVRRKAEGGKRNAGSGTEGPGEPDLPSAFRLLSSVSIIRPLLCLTREEVESYCRERGLEFRTDATNLNLHYTRNRLRNEIMPALKSINPRVVESVSRAAENIAADQDLLDGFARARLDEARLASDPSLPADGDGVASYSVAALLEQPVGMRRRMIIEAIRLTRIGVTREDNNDATEVSSAHVAAVEGLLAVGASGRRIALPGSLEVWREFDAIVLRARDGASLDPTPSMISSLCTRAEAGGFAFTLERRLPAEALRSVMEEALGEKKRTGRDWMIVALDDCSLPQDLVIRPRLPGERAHTVGRRRTIKLKNLMIDHRIPSSRRASWPLVTTPDGAYIWSPGLPPAAEFAAHKETRYLAMMRALAL